MKEFTIHSESLPKNLGVAWLTEQYSKDYLQARGLDLNSPEILDTIIIAKDKSARRIGGLYLNIGIEIACIYLIWVDESHRRKGVGRAMYLEAERLTRSHKLKQMMVSTYDFQSAARFWLDLGFSKCSVIANVPDGATLESYLKQL